MAKNFYLTTTIPYVNAAPHVGFALEIIQADVLARYHRLLGDNVFFNAGTDEHGQKIYKKALEENKDPKAYVDEYAEKFKDLKSILNLSYDNFIRTTDENHKAAAGEFWRLCQARGDIYKKKYEVKYCVGCELEKTDSELDGGKCPDHPKLELEIRDEENYFFRLSNYQEKLLELYARQDYILPSFRLEETKKFVEKGLEDFSISRLKEKMPWGVPVPDDDTQVMYVWFDALVNYISTLGWPSKGKFEEFWPGIQMAGKDQLRPQGIMWQAMLFSAGLPNTSQIFYHGHITSDGQKMSKSLGNVVDPLLVIGEYGTDALRYFLLRNIHPFEDSDFTMDKFKEAYNGNLANGLGNLVARVMKMAESYLDSPVEVHSSHVHVCHGLEALNNYDFKGAMDHIWEKITFLDGKIQETEPFKLFKTDPEAAKVIVTDLVKGVHEVGQMLEPFMPQTSEKIMAAIKENKKPETLFERKI